MPDIKDLMEVWPEKEEQIYKKLQGILRNNKININYACLEFEDFSTIEQSFDCIYLSNVYDYYQDEKKFNRILAKLYADNLKENGTIMAHYSFNDCLANMPKKLGKFKLCGKEITRQMCGDVKTDTIWMVKKQKHKSKTTEPEKLY